MNAHIRLTYVDKDGNLITNPSENDLGYCKETSQICRYEDSCWKPIKNLANSELKLTNYEINRQIIDQMPDLTDEEIAATDKKLYIYLNKQMNKYYMLLCKDISYYTVFCLDETAPNRIFDELITCCEGLGKIKGIELTDQDDALEIWIKIRDKAPVVMYFFSYDAGVIECTQ